MYDDQDDEQQETMLEITKVLEGYGEELLEGAAAVDVARRWLDAGFTDAEEVDDWLRAGCFNPARAQQLEMAGLTPEQASLRTVAGSAAYENTIAYKFAHDDLTLEEARRIITNHFWNS